MKADLGRSKKVITEMRPVVDNFKKEIYEKKNRMINVKIQILWLKKSGA